MSINENIKPLISNTYYQNNEFEPFILHGKRNIFGTDNEQRLNDTLNEIFK